MDYTTVSIRAEINNVIGLKTMVIAIKNSGGVWQCFDRFDQHELLCHVQPVSRISKGGEQRGSRRHARKQASGRVQDF